MKFWKSTFSVFRQKIWTLISLALQFYGPARAAPPPRFLAGEEARKHTRTCVQVRARA